MQQIKDSVSTTAPGATLILFGSYARGDHNEESDIDLLVLVDKDKVTHTEEDSITYPLYDIEFRTGTLIHPVVYTKESWAKRSITPFFQNVSKEGIIL